MSGNWLFDRLACPRCGESMDETLTCDGCGEQYATEDGIYDLVASEKREIDRVSEEMAAEIESRGLETVQREARESTTDEVRRAQAEAGEAFGERLRSLAGATVELATGVEGLARDLAAKPDVESIATDVSIDTLRILRDQLESERPRAFVACNARQLPFETASMDAVVTAGGFNNVAHPSEALEEAARVLHADGSLLSLNVFVEPGSASAEKAAELDVRPAFVRSEFERVATRAGFEVETVELSGTATWTDDPFDLLPVAGDEVRYGFVEFRSAESRTG